MIEITLYFEKCMELAACPVSDALITWIPADEEPLCGSTAVYAIIIIIIISQLICHTYLTTLAIGLLAAP